MAGERSRKRAHAASSDSEPEEVAKASNKNSKTRRGSRFAREEAARGASDSSDAEQDSEPSSGDTSASDSDGEERGQAAADVPLGELIALKQDGGTSAASMRARARAMRGAAPSFKRTHKHRPAEMTSKKPVPVLRDALQAGSREVRDPRFDALTGGTFKEPAFRKRYAFVYDEHLPRERRELAAALKRAKGAEQREALAASLTRVTQQLRTEEARRKREGAERDAGAAERAAVAAGKKPFYPKKSEVRRRELVARYEELAAGGKLDKFMEKRRRKNASKDHRYLPSSRRGGAGDE